MTVRHQRRVDDNDVFRLLYITCLPYWLYKLPVIFVNFKRQVAFSVDSRSIDLPTFFHLKSIVL